MIEFFNVRKQFGEKIVFENLHWKIEKASVIGLVGPNGSGKSTLLRLISGVIDTDHGFVKVYEENVFENIGIKKHIMFVSDDPYYIHKGSLNDMRDLYEIFYPNFDHKRYKQLVELFGLDPNMKISHFSKGMKRQVAIILAFAARPKIMLFDEAFDGLDPLMRFHLRQMIAEFVEEDENIVIISSHNLRELEDICDTVAMINHNKLEFSEQIDAYQDKYHRFRIAFTEDQSKDIFKNLHPLHISGERKIFSVILEGNKDLLETKLQALHPVIIEHSHLSLEERYLLQVGGYRHESKIS